MRPLKFALALLLLVPGAARAQEISVAIFPLSAFAVGQDGAALGNVVRDMLITEFARKSQLRMVERNAIDELMKSNSISLSGAAPDDQMRELGELLGAQYYVGGSVMAQPDAIRLDLRVVDAETGHIANVFKEKAAPDDIIGLVEQAVLKFSDLKVKQRVADVVVPVPSLFAYSRGLDYEKRGNRTKAAEMYQAALDLFPENAAAKAALDRVQ